MLTDDLCTRCGLCCDGTLFGDVELRGPAEAARLEALGLDVDTDDADTELLALPCAGLRGTRCRVYPQRPSCCRTFECRLLQQATRGELSPEAAVARIGAAKAHLGVVTSLLKELEPRGASRLPLAERVSNALAERGSTRRALTRQAELRHAMQALTRTIRTTFLD